jgi:hypothetical protein
MDIHKPKPWHGLREFAKEIGTIVIGVLIALAAEQAVEWLHWRHEVQVAREAITFDLKRLVGGAAAQDNHTVCTGRHLAEIEVVLDRAQATKRLPPMGWPGAPPQAEWSLRSWSALVSGQTLPHFPNREQIILSGLVEHLRRMQSLSDTEVDDWATMAMLAGPGRPITDPEIAMARAALMHAYADAGYLRVNSRAVETVVARSGLISRSEIDAAYKDGIALDFRPTAGFCAPTSPPPPASVAALAHDFLMAPPTRPGEARITTPGVGHAFTTEK